MSHEHLDFLSTLQAIIAERLQNPRPESYTARLAASGITKMAQKVGEEGVELALAAVAESNERLTEEAADLVYHLMLLLAVRGIDLADVVKALERRHRTAG